MKMSMYTERFLFLFFFCHFRGAMENKSLNVSYFTDLVVSYHLILEIFINLSMLFQIFNSKLVLASPETATDLDYAAILGVIGHEVFLFLLDNFDIFPNSSFNNLLMTNFCFTCSIFIIGQAIGRFALLNNRM